VTKSSKSKIYFLSKFKLYFIIIKERRNNLSGPQSNIFRKTPEHLESWMKSYTEMKQKKYTVNRYLGKVTDMMKKSKISKLEFPQS
jgi:hypothetical protein